MGEPSKEKITAADIRAAIKRSFPHPEYGVVFEVAQATGFNAHRHLDAIVMDTWPSRGLAVIGIEIKVDLYDWRREKANPAKAEQIARFCDRFYVAAPKDLIPTAEMPMAWGLLEYDADKQFLHTKRQAEKNKAQPVTKEFLAAIMRAVGRGIDKDSLDALVTEHRRKLEAEFSERVAEQAKRNSENNSKAAENWEALTKALGEDEKSYKSWLYSGGGEIIRAIQAVRAAGVMESYNGLQGMREATAAFLKRLEGAAEILSAPVSDPHRTGVERILGGKKRAKAKR